MPTTNLKILFIVLLLLTSMSCDKKKMEEINDAKCVKNEKYFYLNTDPIIGRHNVDIKQISKLINSAKYYTLVTPEALKKLQLYGSDDNYYRMKLGRDKLLIIKLDPFNNYVNFVELSKTEKTNNKENSLDSTDIQNIFSNYKMINESEFFLENESHVSISSKSNLAMISTFTRCCPSVGKNYFIDINNGRISENSFENYCRFKGYFNEKYDNNEMKIALVKNIVPGIINNVYDISGYDKKKDNEDELKLIALPFLKKYQRNPEDVYVIAYGYSPLGGEVKKYKFVFCKNRLQCIEENVILRGVGDVLLLI